MKKLRISNIKLNSLFMSNKQIPQLRGAISSKFIDNDLFHNHSSSGELIYRSPLVQYKVINKTPLIQVICREDLSNEFNNAVKRLFSNLDNIRLGNKNKKIDEKSIEFIDESIGVSENIETYKIISPMILFNEKNYKRYNSLNIKEKILMVEKSISNHILSLFDKDYHGKGLVVENIKERVFVSLLDFKQGSIVFKKVRYITILGSFSCNVYLPQYLSIGRKKAFGFGTLKR